MRSLDTVVTVVRREVIIANTVMIFSQFFISTREGIDRNCMASSNYDLV